MLFDLKGKRRRVVQVTYLGLAILIGLGLIGFGIGSSTNGPLNDIFGGGGGSNTANQTLQKDIAAANRQLALNPKDTAALKTVIQRQYQLATSDANATTGAFSAKGKQELQHAAAAWDRYTALTPNPDPSVAALMFQAYGVQGLNDPAKATHAMEIVAAAQPSVNAYEQVVAYANLAHDARTVELATRKALQLTPPSQRATVKQQINQLKAAGASTSTGQAGGAPSGP